MIRKKVRFRNKEAMFCTLQTNKLGMFVSKLPGKTSSINPLPISPYPVLESVLSHTARIM